MEHLTAHPETRDMARTNTLYCHPVHMVSETKQASLSTWTNLGKEDFDEVFPNPPIREVDMEVRFAPRLRIPVEIWKFQDFVVKEYPGVSNETAVSQSANMVAVVVFQNSEAGRVIKVSQQNLVFSFTTYKTYEDFKTEVLRRSKEFCSLFGIETFARVGLRYVNEILIPEPEPEAILKYVRPFAAFGRIGIQNVRQFITDLRLSFDAHQVTFRAALLRDRLPTYVLDIDCYSDAEQLVEHLERSLDLYHESAQRLFLDHITEEYKNLMRGKA